MRLVRNILLFIIALYIGIIVFMPKTQIYYYLEHMADKKGVTIGNEQIDEKIPYINIMHPVAYFQGVDIARAANIKVTPLLLTNTLEADDIELLNIAKQFANVRITELKAKQSILKPFIVKIDASGNFGTAQGEINLKNRTVHIDITKAKDISSIRRFLKKGAKGWYYESKF